ncbi:MAG: RluA family pseudouridine synthase [Thermodesulfobacteriota bacterium]
MRDSIDSMTEIAAGEAMSLDVQVAGQRLDIYLADHCERQGLTRSRLQQLIRDGQVLVNGTTRKPGHLLQRGDRISLAIPAAIPTELVAAPVEFLPLYEDDDIIVLVKPPNTVVHPACGHWEATLVHGLLHHCDSLSGINGELRPGIVHRLDKDTSGVMVVAKNDLSHQSLVEQFKGRGVTKIYLAIVDGIPASRSGRIDLPIGRHPVHRKKMAVRAQGGREALTDWRVVEEFGAGFALLEIVLGTGRTHQIRVHMASLGCPVAGDPVYGRSNLRYSGLEITRQCLHAHVLGFCHPRSGEAMRFVAPLWPDMERTLTLLRQGEG